MGRGSTRALCARVFCVRQRADRRTAATIAAEHYKATITSTFNEEIANSPRLEANGSDGYSKSRRDESGKC